MIISKRLTSRAQRWLINHCETITVIENNEERIEPKIVSQFVFKNVILNRYKLKDKETIIQEFIQNHTIKEIKDKKSLRAYCALRFENSEKHHPVVCSLFGYVPDNVKETTTTQE